MRKKLYELAEIICGKLKGDPEILITGAGDIETAKQGDISFIKNKKYIDKAKKTSASALIVPCEIESLKIPTIEVENPYLAFTKILNMIYFEKMNFYKGIHKTVISGSNLKLGKNVSIGPYTVIGENVSINDNTVICSNTYIGDRTKIGKNVLIYSNVSIREDTVIGDNVIIHCGSVIGSDGYGYLQDGKKHIKIPQVGNVIIEDNVEIGSNVSIDRATVGHTYIGRGTKIDNLVHIAHNVVIGQDSLIIAQVGIAGSTRIGNNAILAGQTGVKDNIKIGDNVIAAAKTAILQDLPDNSVVWGIPAIPINQQKRISALLKKLPSIVQEIRTVKKEIENLKISIEKIFNKTFQK